jgi:hypothetical protein
LTKAGTEVLKRLSEQFSEIVSVFKEASNFILIFSFTRQPKNITHVQKALMNVIGLQKNIHLVAHKHELKNYI